MKKRLVLYEEVCYLIGLPTLALGAALMVQANFGISVVISPAYVLHLKLSQFWPVFTFGLAEYVVQGLLLLLLLLLVRRFHRSYLFSFVTVLIYGRVLDAFLFVLEKLPIDALPLRMAVYLLGLLFCALGVALMLRTYLSPEVYELLIRELSKLHKKPLGLVKTIYDCSSCTMAVLMSFCFFGWLELRGVGIGTVISALCSGALVALIGGAINRRFTLRVAFPHLEKYFVRPPFPGQKEKRTHDLRYERLEDAHVQALLPIWSDEAVIRYTGIPVPCTEEEVRERVARLKMGDVFVVYDKAVLIGIVGCPAIDKQERMFGLFYHFAQSAWGKGYATCAAAWLVAYMKETYQTCILLADVVTDNRASETILLHLGFRCAKEEAWEKAGEAFCLRQYRLE